MTDKPQMPDEVWLRPQVYGGWCALEDPSSTKFDGDVRYVKADLCDPTDKAEALRALNKIKLHVKPYGDYIFGKSIYEWAADLEILEEFINGK